MGQIKNKNHDKAVGSRISEMRQKAGFKSLIDFAERYNFDYQTLRSIESGHLTINTATLKWFAETLKVSSDYLLGLTDIQTPNVKDREITDKYGLEEKPLETLSELVIMTPNSDNKVLVTLNAILEHHNLTLKIFCFVYDVLFGDSENIDHSVICIYKDGKVASPFRLDADGYRDLIFLNLYNYMKELRTLISNSNNDNKKQKTKK
jgi:transcriptional regulator with XRE-family HTH domain